MPETEAMKFNFNANSPQDNPHLPPRQARKNLPRMLAWLGIRSACRHVPAIWKGEAPVMLGLVVPTVAETAYAHILELLLQTESHDFEVLHPSRSGRKSLEHQFEGALTESSVTRLGIVVPDEAIFPHNFSFMADAIVRVPESSARHLAVAVWHVLGQRVSDDDAAYLVTQDVHMVEILLRKTRSPSKAAAALRRLAAAEARPVSGSRPDAPRLEDLHGYGEAAVWGMDLARDLADWRSGTLPWSDVDRGVLLSGAPGTGKTTFASALARTCGAHFVPGSYATWQAAGHLGDFQRELRKAFADAKAKAPSILLIDEMDAIGSRGVGDKHDRDYTDKVIASFLEALDGAEGREGVVVVGCANYPDRLDPALRRPGRLDRHIEIPLPDAKARFGILRHHLAGALPGEDLSPAIGMTEGWSGAGLEQLVRQARRLARRHRRDLTVGDLLECLPERVPVPEDVRWRIAVHEAGHAVIGLETTNGLIESVEVGRYRVLGDDRYKASVRWRTDEDTLLIASAERYLARIVTGLGGMAAERVIFGAASDGAGGSEESDLAAATRYAAALEGSLGLGGALTHLATLDHAHLLPGRDMAVRHRVEATLQDCLKRAEAIVEERREDVLAVARAVVERERITGEDVAEIVSRQPRLRLVPGG